MHGRAEALYKALLLLHPDRAEISSLLGILYCQTQRPEEAARLLERAPASDWVAHEFMG
jgi:Tfp pilus assembly protein PilF